MKSLGKPAIVREFSIIFAQVRENSGKTNYLVSISFSLTIGMVVGMVVGMVIRKVLAWNYWHGCSQRHYSNCRQ